MLTLLVVVMACSGIGQNDRLSGICFKIPQANSEM